MVRYTRNIIKTTSSKYSNKGSSSLLVRSRISAIKYSKKDAGVFRMNDQVFDKWRTACDF